jgi:hypothetical protein
MGSRSKPAAGLNYLSHKKSATMKETYTLAADELSALRQFLSLQNLLSVDTAFTDQSILQMMAQLDALSDSYTQFKNAKLRELVDLTYTLLKDVDTCYKQKFPALYITYCYPNFGFLPDLDANQEDGFGNMIEIKKGESGSHTHDGPYGWSWSYGPTHIMGGKDSKSYELDALDVLFLQGGWIYYYIDSVGDLKDNHVTSHMDFPGAERTPWIPRGPDIWRQALGGLINKWDAPFLFRSTFTNFANVKRQIDDQVLSVSHWSDVGKIKSGVAPLWTPQSAMVQAILKEDITLDSSFFLLHLLIALTSGDNRCRALASKTVSAPCSSPEYPNDTFANQLIYVVLMDLADPAGAYVWNVWNNQQLQAFVAALGNTVVFSDPASTAIRNSLVAHGKILYVDTAYPLQDPNSNVLFNVRKTDTLAALDRARSGMAQGAAA